MIKEIQAKVLLSHVKQPDTWFGLKYNFNLYRGCQHQCIYCDSRSECYQIENFKDILVKVNALELLEKELKSKRVIGTIGTGSMNDPYMPIEKERRLMRGALELINRYRFPVHILTKNDLILRDIDLIRKISQVYTAVSFTITTADDELARILEPGAPPPSARFEAIRLLAGEGIYTGILLMPVLPYLEDNPQNIKTILQKAKASGAAYILPSFGMTLRDRQRTYYYAQLDEHFPGLKEKYQRSFGNSYSASARNRKELKNLFSEFCAENNIAAHITPYNADKEQGTQLKLF